jgi:hypothetical protein
MAARSLAWPYASSVRCLVWLVLAGCAVGPASTAPVVATMVRDDCLDGCPVYAVTLYRDGVVEYRGRRNVHATGRRVARVTAAAIAELEAAFARVGFARLRSYSHMDCTCLASATITYQGRTIDHYHGDTAAPSALFELEAAIDRVANTERWTRRDYLYVPWCGSDGKALE